MNWLDNARPWWNRPQRKNAITVRFLLLGLLLGCQTENPEEAATSDPAPPPAMVVAPMRGRVELDRMLELLQKELDDAISGSEHGAASHMVRAEALSDRLLETKLPFEWMVKEQYAVQPRLRQIQALSDRILAQIRSGGRPEDIRREVIALQKLVVDLRQGLRQEGSAAPPTLDRLLAAYRGDTLDVGGGVGE